MSVPIPLRESMPLLLIAGSAAVVVAIYFDSFSSMAAVWSFSGYRHGVIVFPISAYLLWRLRGTLANVDLRPWPLGVAVVAGLVACWLLSSAIGVQTVEHLAIVLLIPAVVATCLGVDLARRALFPLLFLIAAVPVGDALIPYLMRVTADVSAALLRVTGLPVYREGQYISLPGGEFEVADVCSGLRYLVAGTMLALLFSYLTYRSTWRRVLFVAATAFALIFANGLRAFIVMWVASASEMRLLAGEDHVYFGWILFAVVIAGLFFLGTRYAEHDAVDGPRATAAGGAETARLLPVVLVLGVLMLAITARPLEQLSGGAAWLLVPAGALVIWAVSRVRARPGRGDAQTTAAASPYRGLSGALVISLTVAVLVAGPTVLARSATPSRAPAGLEWPAVADCGAEPWDGVWQPVVYAPDASSEASYHCGGHTIHAFVAQYTHSIQGSELVSEQHRLYPEAWRRYVSEGKSRFEVGGRSVEVNEIRVDGGGERALIWYWYRVGDTTATRPFVVKLVQALRVLTGGGADGAIYWLETPLDSARDDARIRLGALASALEHAWPAGGARPAAR